MPFHSLLVELEAYANYSVLSGSTHRTVSLSKIAQTVIEVPASQSNSSVQYTLGSVAGNNVSNLNLSDATHDVMFVLDKTAELALHDYLQVQLSSAARGNAPCRLAVTSGSDACSQRVQINVLVSDLFFSPAEADSSVGDSVAGSVNSVVVGVVLNDGEPVVLENSELPAVSIAFTMYEEVSVSDLASICYGIVHL